MIPRLFPANATYFASGGITTLTDTISCIVSEERNGPFELEMVVSTTTPYFDQIEVGCLILAKPNHAQGPQAFEIYEISKPINQQVQVRAHHISYRTSFIPVVPFSATGITQTLTQLAAAEREDDPFIISTDITNETSTYNQTAPGSLRSRLGGTEGSLLDVFGGEYMWDNFTINLLKERGADNGVQLRLAKNITDLDQTLNLERVITGALPYWISEDGLTTFYGDVEYSQSVSDYAYNRTVLLDVSEQFETAPSSEQLQNAAQQYLLKASLATPSNSVQVSFIDLADTEEYSNSPLERVNLCDTVEVIYPALGVSYKEKAVKLTFDVLAERTLEVEIGDARSSMSKTLNDLIGDSTAVITIGKKLVSITQSVDRELGTITSQVASVQQQVNENGESITTLANTITQNESQLRIDLAQIEQQIGENTDDISEMHTYFTFGPGGLTIGKSGTGGSEIFGVFSNTSLDFVDANDTKLAWLDATDGLGAPEISIGNVNNVSERWHLRTSENGDHLFFLRRT